MLDFLCNVDRFCAYLLGLPYNGSSIVDCVALFREMDISLMDASSGERRHRGEERKRDKYMNWSIAVMDTMCALQVQYRQYHDMEKGTNQLLSLPSLQLHVTGVTTGNDNDPRPAIMILSNGFTVTVATVFSLGWSDV